MTTLLDYVIDDASVESADGTHALTFAGATVTTGPGSLGGESLPSAISLTDASAASVRIDDLTVDARRFRARVVFRVDTGFQGRQNLLESNHLPFAVFLVGDAQGISVHATVGNKRSGWRGATTHWDARLPVGAWHVADLVYDLDTVGLFLDGTIVDVHGFPDGHIDLFDGATLHVGSWVDGRRDRFTGSLAAVRLDSDVPAALESQLDDWRSGPRWHITCRTNALRPGLDLGSPSEPVRLRPALGAYYQRHQHGALMYHPTAGAFEIHGAIYARYVAAGEPDSLGYLVSDEVVATQSTGRQSVFSRGAIYWSPQTGAHEVDGQLYLDYENLGGPRAFGFPLSPPAAISGGRELRLQSARMYHRTGAAAAHEVHGGILAEFLATGGPGRWGFPVSNEMDVHRGSTAIGRSSQFEQCTFYWSGRTGAREVHGDLRAHYQDLAGPAGQLGFPTSHEIDVPDAPGARMNGFEKGALLWYGSRASIVQARPFKVFLGSLNTDESEGFGMGQNDIYVRVTITQGGRTLLNQKYPRSGDWADRNTRDVSITFPPLVDPSNLQPVDLVVDVWESDSGAPFGGGDDHLGKWSKRLDAANGWGLRENNGILDSGSFSKVNNIRVSVKPQVDARTLTEQQKWWGTTNRGTPTLTWSQYAQAFRDVDSDTEWWDITDGLAAIFYEAVTKGVASGGNCVGMSLEAIYARKDSSPFGLPLDRFTTWDTVRPGFNTKQQYQVGAGPIWWFVGQFLSGNTHDPVDVFRRTREAFDRGDNPVLCVSQNYDFSGAPHCILPVGWDSSTKPWRIDILDPNFPKAMKRLTVDPDRNTFEYAGSSTYTGGEWSGGRLHYMPWSVLCEAPRTPVWEAVLLLLSGVVLILGEGATTTTIKDGADRDLDGFGARAREQLQAGQHLPGYFFRFQGLDGDGIFPGELLLARGGASTGVRPGPVVVDPGMVLDLPIASLDQNRDLRSIRDQIRGAVEPRLAGRSLGSLAADDELLERLPVDVRGTVERLVRHHRVGDFVHAVRSTRRGPFGYAVKTGLTEVVVHGDTVTGQNLTLSAKDMASSVGSFSVASDQEGRYDLTVLNKVGVGRRERLQVDLAQVPVTTGQPLRVSVHPGLGTLDILSPGGQVDLPVVVRATADGQESSRTFPVRVSGGARLTLSSARAGGVIASGRIENLGGPVSGTREIRASG